MTVFNSADDWILHVEHDHFPKMLSPLLELLAKFSKRSMIGSVECPICDFRTEDVSLTIDGHITRHMYEFAIRALPWGIGGGGADGNTHSIQMSSGQASPVSQRRVKMTAHLHDKYDHSLRSSMKQLDIGYKDKHAMASFKMEKPEIRATGRKHTRTSRGRSKVGCFDCR